jgi:ABC-2 type transport system ATP-binding protein/lipopolysaccharide transport system ATP-binding protein
MKGAFLLGSNSGQQQPWGLGCCLWDGSSSRQNPMNLHTVSKPMKNIRNHSSNQPEEAIHLKGVSVRYRVPTERVGTFKEYLIRRLKGQVKMKTFWALKDVTLDIQRGEVFGFVGVNGAGKSTLLKVVARVLHPTEGRVIVRGRVAPLLELGAGFHPELTCRENIFLNGAFLGFSHIEMLAKFDEIVEFSELGQFIDAPVRTYSSGMYGRLGFAVATASEPEVLIVDEILGVGDETFQKKCALRMAGFRQNGAAILLVSHNMATITSLCQRAAWLDHGILKTVGKPDMVIEAYRQRES